MARAIAITSRLTIVAPNIDFGVRYNTWTRSKCSFWSGIERSSQPIIVAFAEEFCMPHSVAY